MIMKSIVGMKGLGQLDLYKDEPQTIISYVSEGENGIMAYSCTVKELVDDWLGICDFFPENEARVWQVFVTMPFGGPTFPVQHLDHTATIEAMMQALV